MATIINNNNPPLYLYNNPIRSPIRGHNPNPLPTTNRTTTAMTIVVEAMIVEVTTTVTTRVIATIHHHHHHHQGMDMAADRVDRADRDRVPMILPYTVRTVLAP